MTNIIELKNISKSYHSKKNIKVLKNINFKFKKGKIYSLVGPSGSGKSTIIDLLLGFQKPINGKIYLSIYNATDRRNQINVYADSGSAGETIEKRRANILSPFEPLRPNTIEKYYSRPDWYDHPRQIQFGLMLSL